MTSELKPCPFCGANAEAHEFQAGEYEVSCSTEGCAVRPRTTLTDMETAIADWNTRAVPDVPELVRYRLHWSDFDTAHMEVDSMEGEYVLYSQAAEIIAASHAEAPWRNMKSAPIDGTIINVLARYPEATAGYPRYAGFNSDRGVWLEYSRYEPTEVIPWAWRPRLNWPSEGSIK
ncbi:Lar family restriction alleviation protein [Pseudochrobactrum asaccharolyticum]|uniref:Restriction alleviation protein Lar n=1 Tax=Pseudochrobactrum asaccharolyticum TaxID=354351 RepID=A0A366DY12_9HYPH|nr:Lar family restriction alleviation protein [Pseudochrobactrum asaccharolyticum]RBO94973.1 restriction alleviation protein Lar [Pseudochrobactrum asaccharolyticum]